MKVFLLMAEDVFGQRYVKAAYLSEDAANAADYADPEYTWVTDIEVADAPNN